MDRCSELTSFAAPRAQRDFHLGSALRSNRTDPTDAGPEDEADHTGFHTRIALGGGMRSL